MKKKNYRFLSLLLALPLLLGGCGSTEQQSGQGGGGGGSSSTNPAVTGVTIAEPDETRVLDGTRASLKATVSGEGVSQKVTWTSSDNTVATVTNGVVNFLKVSEQKKVTITAAANDDKSVTDSVEFTVEHSPFDLKNSRGNPDTSLYFDDGSFIIEDPQDIALVYADVHDTRWYVEATIIIDSFDPDDPYPKFGIMASERDDGMWCHEKSHQVFYYVDTVAAVSTWTAMNAVMENSELTDWFWGGQIGSATASPAVKKGEAFKMGLMRDGDVFYQFYGKATDITLKVVGSFEYKSFGEEANYVWVGGWKTGATISGAKYLVGDQIDALYTIPSGISLKSEEETVYLGSTYQIEVEAEGLWNKQKLTFASSDETVATVDAKGLVTAASDKTGTSTITVGLEGTELSATMLFRVTDDLLYNVVLDGELNDAIWSEKVKTNSYLLKKNDNYYVRIYGAKNSRGLYIFMDYVVAETANCNPNEWWTWENVEFRLADADKAWSGQYWVSSMNGGSFVSVGSGEKPEEVYYKALELGADNLYHGAFEMYIPYGDDNNTKGEATYACFGFAPKSGWYNGYNWYAAIDDNTLNITAEGFAHDGTQCSEENGHAYGAWVTDVAATCSADGSAHRDCAICGHRETKVLDMDPEAHDYDFEHAEVTVVPTCIATGIGVATCKLCGTTKSTVLPKDYNNHVDADYPASHNHCHSCGIGSYLTNATGDVYDRSSVGGPWDRTGWYDCGLMEGDFTFTFEFNMKGCYGASNANGDACWRTILPFVYSETYAGDADGHFFRMDWCGFGGANFVKDINDGAFPDGFDWNICNEAYGDMDVVLVYTKVGARINLDWVWTCNATEGFFVGKTFEYHQGCTLIDANAKVGIALASEFTLATITRAELARA